MNSEDSRNLILAIVLSLIVLLGWNYFYGAPQLQRDHQAQTQPNGAAPIVAGTASARGFSTSAAGGAVCGAEAVPPPIGVAPLGCVCD